MVVKNIVDECFSDYHQPSMLICTCYCDWKCAREGGFALSTCQNHPLHTLPNHDIPDEEIYRRFVKNPITKAVVVGGFEPMLQFDELEELISYFRSQSPDIPFVIYTGYNKDELEYEIESLSVFPEVIVKFGRYIPGMEPHFDEVLGVDLASDNQYAEKIS